MIRYVGLDVHKRIVESCILDDAGKRIRRDRFTLTREELGRFATKILSREDRVVLEATTNTWTVVERLKPHVAEVIVSNPLKTKAIAEAKVKTDKVDAFVLAQLLRCDFLPVVWQPDEETLEMRRLTARRSALVADRASIKHRIHALLAYRLIQAPEGRLFDSKKGIEWLRTVDLDAEGRFALDADLRLMESCDKEISLLDAILAKKAYSDDEVKLLMTLPGVDRTVAQAMMAAFGDIKRFKDGDHAAGYLGLVPSTKQSAEHCYHGPITKAGRHHARWMLIEAAQRVATHPGPLGVFFRRLAKKKNRNVAVVAVARKLAVIAWHMLTKKEPYRYALPDATQQKFGRLRRAVGEYRHSGGRKPGQKNATAHERAERLIRIQPLNEIYEAAGLPPVAPLAPGEIKAIHQAAVSRYVESLQHERFAKSAAGKNQ